MFHTPHNKSVTFKLPQYNPWKCVHPPVSYLKNYHFGRINSISSVVCCQVLHLCFQATNFCNICMKSVSSFMSIIVTVFSLTYHLFSWRLTTNDFQPPYYFHILSSHWIWNLHYMKSSVYYHILYDKKKFIFINVTQKCVLLNYCMQRQVTWQPLLSPVTQESQLLWGHIHRSSGHKIKENFKEYFVGGGVCLVVWEIWYFVHKITTDKIKMYKAFTDISRIISPRPMPLLSNWEILWHTDKPIFWNINYERTTTSMVNKILPSAANWN
jgi:hypothetical protein